MLFAVASPPKPNHAILNLACATAGIGCLLAFVAIESMNVRQGKEPLLDLRRLGDRTFAFSLLAHALFFFSRFGLLFLLPIYLQGLRQQTALQSGLILAAQALATLVTLPIGGRLVQRVGPRVVSIIGLTVFAGGTALLGMLGLNTPILLVIVIMVVFGGAVGLTPQVPVTAMSRIEMDQAQEIANGSTLLTVLQATAAPLGVAALSTIVQVRDQHFSQVLAAQGMKAEAELSRHQGSLLAMHDGFLVALFVVLLGLAAMCAVPRQVRSVRAQREQTANLLQG